MLEGRITVPQNAAAAVILASAPALHDELRDNQLLSALAQENVATLYVPLMTDDEQQFDARTGHYRYDADFLAQRFLDAAQWLTRSRETAGLPVGYAGSSGAAAGAIVAAAQRPDLVGAIVSIDGRTDLAIDSLRTLKTPTLLVVRDRPVLRMNREALTKSRGDRRIEIVHGTDCAATECVVQKTARWFVDHLVMVAA